MVTLEQVEKLRTYANVGYEDAKTALETSNGDLLEAVIYLEKMGYVSKPANEGKFTTDDSLLAEKIIQEEKEKQEQRDNYGKEDFRRDGKRFVDMLMELFRKSRVNFFEAKHNGEVVISVPIIILILGLMFFFWLTLPLMVVGLFFNFSYSFKGPDINGGNPLNHAMDGAKNAAEQAKKAFDESENVSNNEEK